jgi:hypothetical protein
MIVVALSGCASPGGPGAGSPASASAALVQAKDRLLADLGKCTGAHGYDPKRASGLAENTLAPGELQWRQCAYDAARRYIAQNPQMRGLYEQLIAEDIELTIGLQQGTVTRSERRARAEELLAQIGAAEDAQMKDLEAQSDRQSAQMQQVIDGLRGLGR